MEKVINDRFDALVRRVELLEKENERKNANILQFENEVDSLKKSKSNVALNGSSWADVLARTAKKTSEQISLINTMQVENNERARREKNVIILGLPVSTANDLVQRIDEEKEMVEKMFSSIGMVSVIVKRVIRLRQKEQNGTQRVAPVVVELENKETRNLVLKASKDLARVNEFKTIYVNADLTESESVLAKQLRDECKNKNNVNTEKDKCYFGIRGMRVIKLAKRL